MERSPVKKKLGAQKHLAHGASRLGGLCHGEEEGLPTLAMTKKVPRGEGRSSIISPSGGIKLRMKLGEDAECIASPYLCAGIY